jgi:hypothetical protein
MKTKGEILKETLISKGWNGYFTDGSEVWKAVLESMEEYAQQFVPVSSDNPFTNDGVHYI